MLKIITTQLNSLVEIQNVIFGLVGLTAVYFYGKYIYKKKGKEFINIDFKITLFEKQFYKDFLFYIGWGFIQQAAVVSVVSLIPGESITMNLVRYASALILFAPVCHFRNPELIKNTFYLGLYIYFGYFIQGYTSVVWMAMIHGFGGTVLKRLDYDMRVWRFK